MLLLGLLSNLRAANTQPVEGGGDDGNEGGVKFFYQEDGTVYRGRRMVEQGTDWTTVPTAFACVGRIASTIASMPKYVCRRTGQGVENYRPVPHYLNNVLARPSRYWDRTQTWEMVASRMVASGNAFLAIEHDSRGRVRALYPCLQGQGSWYTERDGRYMTEWELTLPVNAQSFTAQERAVVRLHGPGLSGLSSPSPIRIAAQNTLKSYKLSNSYVNEQLDDIFSRSVVESDAESLAQTSHTAGSLQQALDDVAEAVMVSNEEGTPLVIPPGFSIKNRDLFSPNDMQLIRIMEWTVEEICRIFAVPPRMVGHYSAGVRVEAKIGSQAEDYWRYAVFPWVDKIEAQLTAKLLTQSEQINGFCVKFLDQRIREGSYHERAEVARTLYADGGIMTQNEARDVVGLPPVPGGDTFQVPRGGGGDGGRPQGSTGDSRPGE